MSNIWHIWHTKHQKISNIRYSKSHNFCNMLQYHHIFDMVRTFVAYDFIIFLFIFLSHPNYLFRLFLQLFIAFSYLDVPSSLFFFSFFFFKVTGSEVFLFFSFFFLKVIGSKFFFLFFQKCLRKYGFLKIWPLN